MKVRMERILNQPSDTQMHESAREAHQSSIDKSRPEATKVGSGAHNAGGGDQAYGGIYNKIY
jgi:hypothetical protein